MAGARRTWSVFSRARSPRRRSLLTRYRTRERATLARPEARALVGALAALATLALPPSDARADGPTPAPTAQASPPPATPPVSTAPRRVEVRLSLSRAAAEALAEPRVRRLLEI